MRTRGLVIFGLGAALALTPSDGIADTTTREAFWLGYMSSWWLAPSRAIWFDTHLNFEAFFVLRGGYTYRFSPGPTVTGGYAYLLLNPDFTRQEHRPWGQLFAPFRLSDRWNFSFRFRVDARFVESLQDGEPSSGYDFALRTRLQTTLTRRFGSIGLGKPLAQLSWELLVNVASDPPQDFIDQNRLSALVGLEMGDLTIRVGYMGRYLPNAADGNDLVEHAALLWFTTNIDLRKWTHEPETIDRDDYPELGTP